MKAVILTTVLILSALKVAPSDGFVAMETIGSVLDIIKVSKDIVVGIAKAWNLIDNHVDISEIPLPIFDKTERKLFDRMNIINNKLDSISILVDAVGTTTLANVLQNLPQRTRFELRLNDLLDYITRLNVYYDDMSVYSRHKDDIERLTLEDYANNVVSSDQSSVKSLVERIHAFISPKGRGISDTGILSLLQEIENDMRCNTEQSPQQLIYNLYNSIALTELKGYTMIQFSYMLLKLYDKGNFTREAMLVEERYKQRANEAIKSVKAAMEKASKDHYKCDPKKYVEGETYVQVTNLLQGYVQNEVDLNPDATCRENCAEYTYTKSHGCFKNLYCQQQRRCNGKIINCRFVDSDMWICPAAPSSGRRYEYIEYENGRTLGRKVGCSRGTTKVDSWWRWLFWHCSYCFCLCDEQGAYSDRYINMRAAIANITHNKVVTGLRFTKHNSIIHLQIQEGKLLPRGKIDPTTLRWVPVSDYKVTDRNIYNGQDFHTLTWEKRALDLDDLKADDDHIVTGVRFKQIGSHLNFEIYTTPFNFETGELISPETKSSWKDNPNTDASIKNPRTKVHLVNPDIPSRSPSPSEIDSHSDQYIEFTHSDIDRDAAQTTVPFIDSQKVESLQPVPLSGAGIYHKGRKNFGGFVAPKIITYDFAKHLQIVFPDDEPEVN